MKEIFIYAWLAGNLGDDLFVQSLCERYPTIQFCVLADKQYKERFSDIKNLKVYSGEEKKARIVNKIAGFIAKEGGINGFFRYLVKNSAAVVHIGGSVFTQHEDDWSSFYEADAFLAEKSKRLYQISGNFGPYTDEKYYKAYHELFKKYRGICFRDSYSYEKFKDLPNISWAPDVIFQYKSNIAVKKKKIVISPVELENRDGKWSLVSYEKAYCRFHVEAIRQLLKEEYQVVMVSFCPGQGDGAMMQKILEGLDANERIRVRCVAYTGNRREILQEFEDAEGVIGTRFHSSILGFIHNCKVLPIIYDQKTEHVLDDMNYSLRVKLSELEHVKAGKKLEELLAMEPIDLKNWERRAEEQFQYIDKFIEFYKRG